MKLNLGMNKEEKDDYLKHWHRKFAWVPRRVASHDWRWLEFVERRCYSHVRGMHGEYYFFQYRPIDKKETF